MTKIHKEVFGQGEVIVMLHGWAMHTGVWRTFAQQLAKDHLVVCLDLPGHGESEPVALYTLDNVVDALLPSLPESPCTLLGWSLGGSVALRLAEKYPLRVKRVVMIASNPHFEKTERWEGVEPEVLSEFSLSLQKNCTATLMRFMSLQVRGMQNMKSCLKQIKVAMQLCDAPSPDVLMGGLGILQTADLRKALSDAIVPLLIILGQRDLLVPVGVAKHCQSLQARAEVHVIEGARHIPFITHQQQVLALIQDFMIRGDP